jgi:type IV secretory pathway TrbF-like protein
MSSPLPFQRPDGGGAAPTPGAAAAALGQQTPAVPIDPQLLAARRTYAEQFGDVVAQNTYWKVAVVALALVCLFLIASQIKITRTIAHFKPLVIRIDSIGKAEVVRYDDFTYTPREAEIKYFLAQFIRLYYSRNRETLGQNFKGALVFLDRTLADSVIEAWTRQGTIENYVRSNIGTIDVDVKNVTIAGLQQPPYQATVEFDEIYYAARERTITKRILYTAHFSFSFHSGVLPTAVLASNPLGLVIHYFREDAALEGQGTN